MRKTFFVSCLLCCCETDPVFIIARLPVAGYTPGQTIELFLDVNNKSDQTFQDFQILIIKVSCCYACVPKRLTLDYKKNNQEPQE